MVGKNPKCGCELNNVIALRGSNKIAIPLDVGTVSRARRRQQAIFLRAYRQGLSFRDSIRLASAQTRTFERWIKDDSLFKDHYELVLDTRTRSTAALLEEELIKRAIIGERTPIVNQGRIVTHVMKKSDKLLELALRANLPEKYAPKQRDLTLDLSQDSDGNKHIKAYVGFDPEEV